MASQGQDTGPYALDSQQVRHRGVLTTTIINTPKLDSLIMNLDTAYD